MSSETLLAWCAQNRIQIDPRIEITDDYERGFSVHSRDEWIECACTRESSSDCSLRTHQHPSRVYSQDRRFVGQIMLLVA